MQIVIYFKDFLNSQNKQDNSNPNYSEVSSIIPFVHECDSQDSVTHEEVGKWVDILMNQTDKDLKGQTPKDSNAQIDIECDILANALIKNGVI